MGMLMLLSVVLHSFLSDFVWKVTMQCRLHRYALSFCARKPRWINRSRPTEVHGTTRDLWRPRLRQSLRVRINIAYSVNHGLLLVRPPDGPDDGGLRDSSCLRYLHSMTIPATGGSIRRYHPCPLHGFPRRSL
ncbi:hypothetical protein DFH06DRAFT_1221999 [Mycena polygramma]|nr:hypothetical protein DFH06DRAFT_1221999 [Mycena polygramma]